MTTTADPISRLPFTTWSDDLAWMETMRGPKWRRALAAEQHTLTVVQNLPAVRRTAAEARNILQKAQKEGQQFKETVQLPRYIPPAIRGADEDFDISPVGVAALVPREQGSGFLTLAFFKAGARIPTWQRKEVGGAVAIREGRVYYTRTDPATGRTTTLESADALTGGNMHILYENKDPEAMMTLIKGEAGALWFQVDRSGKSALYHLEICGEPRAVLIDDDSYSQIPLGLDADGRPVWIANSADGKQILQTKGQGKQQMPALPADGFFIHAGSAAGRWLIGHLHGCDRLYIADDDISTPYKKVYEVVGGEITYEAAALAASPASTSALPPFLIESIEAAPQRLVIVDGIAHTHSLIDHLPAYSVSKGQTTSHDGTAVHFLIARKGTQALQGLLVYGYGSYGSRTPICRARTMFAPLLEKGWAIAFAFIRGGGDRGEAWSTAGRFVNRTHSLEDFEAVILAARGRLGVPAERTVLSGRSAGGALVGAMVARHLDGGLFKGVFTEEPFVDGLRTMSNRAYPYTTPEFGEYGNPAHSLTEFMTVFGISATNRLPICGAPAIFVLARAGENDSQVLAYEPLKWIWRLRGQGFDRGATVAAPEGKLFAFGKSQGHFYDEEADLKARSSDLAVLHNWITQPVVRQKISAMSIKMANNARKNRNTRKNMKGGKKAKRSTTRKARKASRKNRKH